MLDLGDEVEVRVDDIDPQGKVSLSLAAEPPPPAAGNGAAGGRRRAAADGRVEVSFEDICDDELEQRPSATSGRPTPRSRPPTPGADADRGAPAAGRGAARRRRR